MSSKSTAELCLYVQSRVPVRLYVPLALFLSAAACAGGLPEDASRFAVAALTAYTLVFQFRLWDDLADLARDRAEHPERVLVRAPLLAAFRALCATLFPANVALIAAASGSGARVAILVALNAIVAAWYSQRAALGLRALPAAHVLLLKYPAFVFLVSPPGGEWLPLALAMTLVYLCFGIHEIAHDESLRPAGPALAGEIGALCAVVAAMVLWSAPHAVRPVLGALALGTAAVLVRLFQEYSVGLNPAGRWRYAAFLVSAPVVVAFAWRNLA
ncbi:MAG: hypothetical protein ACREVR_18790 [Burkholderiales bacterium]